jgi:ATP-dependent Lon protease
MTGEITLRGTVLPVGGIKEKVLAARRSGIRTVVLPEANRKNLEEIPKSLRRDLEFRFVRQVQEVFNEVLVGHPALPEASPPPASARGSLLEPAH